MKSKSFALTIVIVVMFFVNSLNSLAGSSSAFGYTSGPVLMAAWGNLYCGNESASATTGATTESGVTFRTGINYSYYDSLHFIVTHGTSGTTSAYVYNPYGTGGVSASSTHNVNGGSGYGTWSANLSTNY
jgi:hypothetical protein